MKALAAAAFIFCFAFSAHAQGLPARWGNWNPFSAPQQPHPAVVRVVAPEGEGTMSLGSGTLVAVSADKGLVVTNWHVVKDSKGNPRVIFPDGFQSAGAVLKVDADWDLAAIAIWRPKAEPVPLANAAPQPGDALTIAGYGSGNYRAAAGPCLQYLSPGANLPPDIIEMSAKARQGDSGGPIFNSRGELAGVLFGEGGGNTSGSHCGRVRWFLGPLIAVRTEAPPHVPLAQGPREAALPPTSQSREASLPLAAVPRRGARRLPEPSRQDPAQLESRGQMSSARLPQSREGEAPAEPYPTATRREPRPPEVTNEEQQQAAIDSPSHLDALDLDWRQLTGTTPLEKTKSALAAVGILALLLQISKQMKAPPPPAEPPPAKPA